MSRAHIYETNDVPRRLVVTDASEREIVDLSVVTPEQRYNVYAQTYPRHLILTSGVPVAGTVFLVPVYLSKGQSVGSIQGLYVTTGTLTLLKYALFALDGQTQYAVTADVKAAAAVNTFVRHSFSAAWTVPASGFYYAAMVHVGTGASMAKASSTTIAATPFTGEPFLAATGGTGQTDMPATVTPAASTTAPWWLAVGP